VGRDPAPEYEEGRAQDRAGAQGEDEAEDELAAMPAASALRSAGGARGARAGRQQ
jgi:hypothetical protein